MLFLTMLLRSWNPSNFQISSVINRKCYTRTFSSRKTSDPLRILFCGSDDFSVTSLKAVHEEHKQNIASIASIDVVCRPGKRVGRGLKTVREVPIADVARGLFLPLHEVDTFTGWTPPTPQGSPINLVIAVSYGRLVPPRILNGAKYGGLNVHPSMLPDFYGPAPIHHTLLSNCSRTGVTLQTMHPQHFDQGVILDQTLFPGFEHGCTTVPELSSKLAPLGAEMLLRAIRNRYFVSPHENGAWEQKIHGRLTRHAPKITAEDSHIDWKSWTADDILRKQAIVGPLWSAIHAPASEDSRQRRVIWSSGFTKGALPRRTQTIYEPGMPYSMTGTSEASTTCINTADGQVLQVEKLKLDGERERGSVAALTGLGARLDTPVAGSEDSSTRLRALWFK